MVGVGERQDCGEVDRQQQPSSHVPVRVPAAADLVQLPRSPEMRQERVVEDDASGEPDVRDGIADEDPGPRLARIGAEESNHREDSAAGRVDLQHRPLDLRPVGDHSQDRAAARHDSRRYGHSKAPHGAAGERKPQERGLLPEGVLEQDHEVDGQNGSPDARGERRVRPVVHAPAVNGPSSGTLLALGDVRPCGAHPLSHPYIE